MKQKLIHFFKTETVLSVAAALAVLSCFLTPPDGEYIGYINFDTLIILFCLMAVMAGFKSLGVFQALAHQLLRRVHGQRGLVFVLVFLCFLGSMLITNDVALITFVPLAILVLDLAGQVSLLPVTTILMTIAANLGSILTPIGNPQNLYLYAVSGMSLGQFIGKMAPFTIVSAILLAISIRFAIPGKTAEVPLEEDNRHIPVPDLVLYLILFALCLLSVAHILPQAVLLPVIVIAVAIRNWKLLLQVDYGLLATFVCFFLFIGNMGRFAPFRDLILSVLEGRVLPVSIALSQVVSNVPAALLLSGFTQDWGNLLIGVNLGGLGTLIASMASLISYKQFSARCPEDKGKYLLSFTLWNVGFLAVLSLVAVLLP